MLQVAAIDDECSGLMGSAEDRLLQLQSGTAADGHPLRNFSFGNAESLLDGPEAAGVHR